LVVNDSIFIDAPVLRGKFEGLILPGDSVLDMILLQGGFEFSIIMNHLKGEFSLNRPQEPKIPFPYKVEEVQIKNERANIVLSGTLTVPEDNKIHSAVILVSGSGPQNRDEELFGHKPFLVIADHLTRNGIAVLRYDDRGVNKSTGNYFTANLTDFVADAESVIDFLKKRVDINPAKIGIIGHSEGALIAEIVASSSSDIGFIILLAGPGINSLDMMKLQIKMINNVQNVNAQITAEELTIVQKEYDFFKAEKENSPKTDSLRQGLYDFISTSAKLSENKKRRELADIKSEYYKTLLLSDAQEYVRKIKCPVLALNGGNDVQVAPDENLEGIKKCLTLAGNKQYIINKFEGLNHAFQHCSNGDISKYGEIEETFAIEVLNYMANWIKK